MLNSVNFLHRNAVQFCSKNKVLKLIYKKLETIEKINHQDIENYCQDNSIEVPKFSSPLFIQTADNTLCFVEYKNLSKIHDI